MFVYFTGQVGIYAARIVAIFQLYADEQKTFYIFRLKFFRGRAISNFADFCIGNL